MDNAIKSIQNDPPGQYIGGGVGALKGLYTTHHSCAGCPAVHQYQVPSLP